MSMLFNLCTIILCVFVILVIVLVIYYEYSETIREVILNLKIRYYIENYQYKKVQNLMEGNEDDEYFKKVIDLYSQFDNLKNSSCYDKFAFYLYNLINMKKIIDLAGQGIWVIELSGHTAAVTEWRPLALWFLMNKQEEAEERPLLPYSSFYLSYKDMGVPHKRKDPRILTDDKIAEALAKCMK